MTLFVGLLWESYSVVSGVPSELAAICAPTRLLWMWLGAVYAVLMVAFGWIVWTSAPPNGALRIVNAGRARGPAGLKTLRFLKENGSSGWTRNR